MKTLDLVNIARKEFRLEPLTRLPKGVRENNWQCPIARALHEIDPAIWVNPKFVKFDSRIVACRVGLAWGEKAKNLTVDLPKVIALFIKKFDLGYYPKYEQKS